MAQQLTQAQQAKKDGLEEEIQMPEIARQPYRGPSESVTALTRAVVLGVPAFFIGKFIGQQGETLRSEGKVGIQPKNWSMWLGGAAALIGLYSASKEVRDNQKQTQKLKRTIEKLHEQNVALKTELRDQLSGKGVLTAFKEEWTQPQEPDAGAEKAVAEAPSHDIQTKNAEHSPSKHALHGHDHGHAHHHG